MVASIGKGTVAQYYLRRTEYYLNGKEPAGVWLSDSPALGIKVGQIVEADLFEKLHAGVGPDGRLLITNDGGKERMPGFDLTLSAPKSVSIAFALADAEMRAAIERVQMDASKAVIAMLNREAAFTRRGRNGVIIEKTSLIVAAFQHGEARPAPHIDGRVTADMDSHVHLCIVNAGRNRSGMAMQAQPLEPWMHAHCSTQKCWQAACITWPWLLAYRSLAFRWRSRARTAFLSWSHRRGR